MRFVVSIQSNSTSRQGVWWDDSMNSVVPHTNTLGPVLIAEGQPRPAQKETLDDQQTAELALLNQLQRGGTEKTAGVSQTTLRKCLAK